MKLIIFILLGIIIFLIYSNKRVKVEENFQNLIDNGSFEGGKYSSNNVGSNQGNSIIKKINPGKSSFVLRQTAKIGNTIKRTRYQMTAIVLPSISYRISLWCAHTKDWDGNYNLFNITFHKDCGDDEILIKEGSVAKRKIMDNTVWEYRELIFDTPSNSNGKIDVYVGYDPNNHKGFRFITDITLERYYPLIKDLPIQSNLLMYLSSNKKESFMGPSSLWKDISMNGNDMKFMSSVKLDNNDVHINKISGIGPNSDKIIPNEKQFTFIWSGKMKEFTKGNLFTLYANNDSNIGISVDVKSGVGINNILAVSIGSTKFIYKIGLAQKKMTYILTRNNNNLELYLDGFKITPEKKINKIPENLEINSKQMVLNKDAQLDFKLDYLIVYDKDFTPNETNLLVKYIETKVVISQNKGMCRPDINKKCSCTTNLNMDKIYVKLNKDLVNITKKYLITKEQKNTKLLNSIESIKCPFKVSCKENPCQSFECTGSDWGNFKVSDKCKNVINNYCRHNKDKTCDELRRRKIKQTSNCQNGNCNSSKKIIGSLQKNIIKSVETQPNSESQVKHSNNKVCPDMSKYIRKDKIPCWGCNLK